MVNSQSTLSDLNLVTFLKSCVHPGQTLVIGLSGGLDSCVLLHQLHSLIPQLGCHLRAVHVNHQLHPEAHRWAGFCQQLCMRYNIPLQVVTLDIPRGSKSGLEATARQLRYQALCHHADDSIVLAHHQNDQAETVLYRLARGSGVKGLAAMSNISYYTLQGTTYQLLRPLLNTPQSTLRQYASQHHLDWIEDTSNLNEQYDRNFLRHNIIPTLALRFPAIVNNLTRSASHMAEAQILLNELAMLDGQTAIQSGRLQLAALASLNLPRQHNLLRYWLASHQQSVSSRRLHEILRQLHSTRNDVNICITTGYGAVRRYRNYAYYQNDSNEKLCDTQRVWQGETMLSWATGTLYFEATTGQGISLKHTLAGQLQIRCRTSRAFFQPDVRRPKRSLSYLFQEAGIPPWQRHSWPLLYIDQTLIAIPEIGIQSAWQAKEQEPGLAVRWQPQAWSALGYFCNSR